MSDKTMKECSICHKPIEGTDATEYPDKDAYEFCLDCRVDTFKAMMKPNSEPTEREKALKMAALEKEQCDRHHNREDFHHGGCKLSRQLLTEAARVDELEKECERLRKANDLLHSEVDKWGVMVERAENQRDTLRAENSKLMAVVDAARELYGSCFVNSSLNDALVVADESKFDALGKALAALRGEQ